MALTVSYPWDPTGTNDTCYIKGESYALSSISNSYRCIIPESAPFYKKGLVVTHTASGKTLQEGIDYYLGHRYIEVAAIASLELYGSINFINPNLFGEIVLDYRTVGGPFIPVKSKVAEYLANYLNDPVTVSWDEVFNKPEYYPAVDHEQIWSDVVNTEVLAASVKSIEDAVDAYAASKQAGAIDVIVSRIAALNQYVTDTQFDKHIVNLANPHKVTYAQADALGDTQSAVESMKLYAKTIQELAAYINASGITQSQLDAYVSKCDDAFLTKHLKLTDGAALICSSGVTSSVSMNSGNIVMSCAHTSKILANYDDIADESVFLQAGNNVLRIRSKFATVEDDYLTYNDKVVIHLGNLKKYLGNINFGTVHVTVQNTATGAWTGIGTAADPLKLSPIIPAASLSVSGRAKLSVATNSTDETAFAVSKALSDVMANLTGFVPITTTVNGHALSSDITLTKSDFGLGLVDNTSDLNKPISTPQQTALSGLSPAAHTHPWSQIQITLMSTLEAGVAKLATTRDEAANGVAAAPSLLRLSVDYYTSANALIRQQLLKRGTISMIHYIPNDVIVYQSSWVVTMPAGQLYANGGRYSIDTVDINLESLFGATPVSRTWYVHVTAVAGGAATYSLESVILTDNQNRLYVGKLVSDSSKAAYDTVTRRVSFGMFKELKEHITATSDVHLYPGDASAIVGLDLVENYPMQHYAHQFSPLSIVKTWNKVSYGTNNDAKWYPAADRCSLFCDLVALTSVIEGRWTLAKMWDRLQPSGTAGLTYARARLRDAIWQKSGLSTDIRTYCDANEIILGVYADTSALTHTLSLAFYQSTTDSNVVRSKLYYNKGLASEVIVGEFWSPTYGMSFATPPGGVYTTWSRLNLYYDIEFGNDQGTPYIQVVLKSNVEWGSPSRTVDQTNNRTVTKFTLAKLPDFPYKSELFNSGSIGMLTRKPVTHLYSWFDVTTPFTKSAYASANLVMELTKRGLGMSVGQQISAQTSGYDLALGCHKSIVLISPRVITTVAGKGIDKFSTSAFQASNGSIETLDSSYLNASVNQITDGAAPTTQTYTITTISFNDEIDLIEVP